MRHVAEAAASERRCTNKRSALGAGVRLQCAGGALVVVGCRRPKLACAVIVVETSKGTFSFNTYPDEAPQTVRHIVELVRSGFYDGQRFHRVVPGFVVPVGRSAIARSHKGSRAGVAARLPPVVASRLASPEIAKKRTHTKGAVGLSHFGNPTLADSQILRYVGEGVTISTANSRRLRHIVSGSDVVDSLQQGDVINRISGQGMN